MCKILPIIYVVMLVSCSQERVVKSFNVVNEKASKPIPAISQADLEKSKSIAYQEGFYQAIQYFLLQCDKRDGSQPNRLVFENPKTKEIKILTCSLIDPL